MISYLRIPRVKPLMRWGILGLVSLLLVIPFTGASTSSVSAQAVDEDRLEIALLQAYFLSVDNFAGPVMMGGVGLPLVPTMFTPEEFAPMMAMMAQMADFDLSTMPANPGLLSAIYTSADPKLPDGTTVDPMDFGTMRWDPAGFDTTITTRDQALVILKFVEWAKFFHKGFGGEAILFPSPEMEAFLSLAFTAEGLMISNFTGQNLTGAEFDQSTLTDADFTGAVIAGASFKATTGFTAGQLYSTASYQSGDLRVIIFSGNDLSGSDLSGQDLTQSVFRDATLSAADFSHANLTRVRMENAILTNANLSGANLTDATLSEVTLTGADFTGAGITGV
ncbi:MAG: pentapeptide repeat-containing protein, partial [Chloroflexi bacterium]|nr:pentapeptide repeat-containing protein [Chloroflexota bacterium]